MTINPILALELRARWRNNRSFLLLLAVALALSLLTGFIYDKAVDNTANNAYNPMTGVMLPGADTGASDDNARLSVVGRELFVALAHTNILCWLFIAAMSAATGIACERERGLLESLQLSRISARSQIAARFAANLTLLGALQLVLLPIYAVAFIMRGIAPEEIAQAFLLVVWASVTGTSIGLWFSSRAHRPTNALFSALGAIALFSLGVLSGSSWLWSFGFGFGLPPVLEWWFWLGLFHPSVLFSALASSRFGFAIATASDALILFSIAHFTFDAALLWSATRNVNRNLAPASWGQNSILVDKLRARQVAKPPTSKAAQRASGALLTDIPLDRFVHFANPLLAREVKARFRLRRAGVGVSLVRGSLFLLVASVWIIAVASLFDKVARKGMAEGLLMVTLYGGALVLAVLSATSWTREREGGTWESLKLSLLTPREILRAKWLSPLISFAYYSAPMWILLPFGALFVRLDAFVLGIIIVIVWLGLAVALGLLISWRVANGTAAIAWTVGVLAMLMIGAPILDEIAGASYALATQKFGIGGSNSTYSFDPYFGDARDNADIVQIYKAETGRSVPLKLRRWPTGAVEALTPEWTEFQDWGERHAQRAERYRRHLMAWNPTLTLGYIFWDGAPKVVGQKGEDRLANFGWWLLFSALPPALLTLALLLLLRRDVRREQLGL